MELHAIKTWYDQRMGVVVVQDDVLGIVHQIREIDPRIHVFYNEQSSQFDLVEHCLDGVQRLIFSVPELDARVISRLREGDSWLGETPQYVVPDEDDFLAKVEADQEKIQADQDEESMEKIRDAGERLAWALDVAGVGYHDSILVTKDVSDHGHEPE